MGLRRRSCEKALLVSVWDNTEKGVGTCVRILDLLALLKNLYKRIKYSMKIIRKISVEDKFTTVLLLITGMMLLILQQAVWHYSNTVVYMARGDSYKYKRLGETGKAEQAYLHAWYMNSTRFSKYLLTKLYEESGQKGKTVITAQELLEKQVKIESIVIEEVRVELEGILLKRPNFIKEGNSPMLYPEFKLQKW